MVVKVRVIPGVLLQSPLKSAIMAPLNPGSLWVVFPIVGWYRSNLGLQSSLQKHLSLCFPCSPGTYKCRHNQHLESFLRSVDEKDSLRAWYYSVITCQVSGLQSLCYSEELVALDVCMNPFTSAFMLWWLSFPFGTKIYYDHSLTKLNECLSIAAALSECKINILKEIFTFKNILFWRLWVCSNYGAVTGLCESPVVFAVAVRNLLLSAHELGDTFCGVSSDLTWSFTSLTPPVWLWARYLNFQSHSFSPVEWEGWIVSWTGPVQGWALQQGCSAQWLQHWRGSSLESIPALPCLQCSMARENGIQTCSTALQSWEIPLSVLGSAWAVCEQPDGELCCL